MSAAQTAPEEREELRQQFAKILTTNFNAIPFAQRPEEGTAEWHLNQLLNAVAAHDQALIQRVREALEGLGNTPIKKLEPKPNEPLEVTYYQEAFKDCITEITAVLDELEGKS